MSKSTECELTCSLCNEKIWEYERFDRIMRFGYVKYYHDSCAVELVQEKLDKLEVDKRDNI